MCFRLINTRLNGVTDNDDSVSSLPLTQDRIHPLSKVEGTSLANEDTHLLVVQKHQSTDEELLGTQQLSDETVDVSTGGVSQVLAY
ncbi:MAG: hypothetical protein ACI9HI_001846 [Salinirussus sp.]|jgi:hypothetical protein